MADFTPIYRIDSRISYPPPDIPLRNLPLAALCETRLKEASFRHTHGICNGKGPGQTIGRFALGLSKAYGFYFFSPHFLQSLPPKRQ